jgi:hypothetical protein
MALLVVSNLNLEISNKYKLDLQLKDFSEKPRPCRLENRLGQVPLSIKYPN